MKAVKYQLPNIPKYLFCLSLFILPFVFWPWAKVSHEIPRVWYFLRFSEIFAFLVVLYLVFNPKKKNLDIFLMVLIAVWLAVAVISSFLGVDLAKSVTGNYYRGDGLITFFHLIGFALAVGLSWDDGWKVPTSLSVILGSVGVSIWAIIDYLRGIKWEGGVGATFGNPNFLGGYLLVTLPFFAFFLFGKNAKHRWLYRIGFFVQIAAILLTHSWSSLMGVFLTFGFWIILKSKKFRWIILFAGLVSFLILVSFWFVKYKRAEPYLNMQGRERIFTKIILGTLERPFLGYGWANTDYAFEKVIWPIKIDNEVYVDKAHSNILESFAAGGILGLTAYLILLGYLFQKTVKNYTIKKDSWSLCILSIFLIYLFHSQTNIVSIGEEVIFWLIAGITLTSAG